MAESQPTFEAGLDMHAQAAAAAQGKKRTRSTTAGPSKEEEEALAAAAATAAASAVLPATPARRAGKAKTASKARGPKEGHWTEAEHALFLECWHKYGKAWKKIAAVMKTRSNEQIRTHAQKYFSKLSQLRHCGYDGDYSMDGTRHLTKSFVNKAKTTGKMASAWPPRGWVNPIKEAKRGETATSTTGTRHSRRLCRWAAPATAEEGGAVEEGMNVAAVQQLPQQAPFAAVGQQHAAAPSTAMPALSAPKTLPNQATMTTAAAATAGGDVVNSVTAEEEAEDDMSVYGPLDALLDGDLELPDTEPEPEQGQGQGQEQDGGNALDIFTHYMDGGTMPRSASVADSLDSSSATTSLPSTTAAAAAAVAVAAMPVGPDASTHDEATLAVLLEAGPHFHMGGGVGGISPGVMWGSGQPSKSPQDFKQGGQEKEHGQGKDKGPEQGTAFYWDGERSTIEFE